MQTRRAPSSESMQSVPCHALICRGYSNLAVEASSTRAAFDRPGPEALACQRVCFHAMHPRRCFYQSALPAASAPAAAPRSSRVAAGPPRMHAQMHGRRAAICSWLGLPARTHAHWLPAASQSARGRGLTLAASWHMLAGASNWGLTQLP